MRKRITAFALCCCLIIGTGCGSVVPKLSEEERELVSEYAASLLLKYDSENHSRLVDTTEFMDRYNAALAAREESIRKYEEEKERRKAEKEAEKARAEEEAAKNSKPADDGTGGATVIGREDNSQPQMSIAEYFGATGFNITYAGYDIIDRYPEDSTAPISASTGKDLLVVYFNAYAEAGGTLDIFNHDASFKVSVNGGPFSTNYMTVLDDDMSQFLGDFSQGETKRLVAIFEVPEGTNVGTLSMSLDGDTYDTMVVTLVQ